MPTNPVQADVAPSGGNSTSEDKNLIFSEIEATAKYHTPGTYQNLLSYYSNLTLDSDSLAEKFIPLSAVAQRARNPKIFAIGVLPPAINVNGLAQIARGELSLDRSQSIGAVQGTTIGLTDINGDPIRFDTVNGVGVIDNSDDTSARGNSGTVASSQQQQKWGSAARDRSPEFWQNFVSMCRRQNVDPIAMAALTYNESGFNPAAANHANGKDKPAVAKGLIQFTHKTARIFGMSEEDWDNFQNLSAQEQLGWTELYMRRTRMRNTNNRGLLYRKVFGGFNNPDGSLYSKDAVVKGFTDGNYQELAYRQNAPLDVNGDGGITVDDLNTKIANLPPSFIRQLIAEAIASEVDIPFQDPTEPPPATRVPSWGLVGAIANNQSREYLDKVADSGLNATKFGQALTVGQRAQAISISKALQNVRDTPPLRMLVNPRSFSVKSEKIVTDGNWGRDGPIIEFWGDNQDKISASGSVAAFYSIDRTNAVGPGLTRNARNFSQAYQNFMSLFLLYRNNAGLYLKEGTGADSRVNLNMLGSMYIFYDDILYIGSFDSFNVTEEDTKPFTMDYSFEFTVRAAFLLDRPDDSFLRAGREKLRVQQGRLIPQGPNTAQINQPVGGFTNG